MCPPLNLHAGNGGGWERPRPAPRPRIARAAASRTTATRRGASSQLVSPSRRQSARGGERWGWGAGVMGGGAGAAEEMARTCCTLRRTPPSGDPSAASRLRRRFPRARVAARSICRPNRCRTLTRPSSRGGWRRRWAGAGRPSRTSSSLAEREAAGEAGSAGDSCRRTRTSTGDSPSQTCRSAIWCSWCRA